MYVCIALGMTRMSPLDAQLAVTVQQFHNLRYWNQKAVAFLNAKFPNTDDYACQIVTISQANQAGSQL
jgi:hypothetical protein